MTEKKDPRWLKPYWVVWAVASFLAFAIPEAIALISKGRGGTLSENTRALLGVEPRKPHRAVGASAFVVIVGGFFVWFVPHILQWPIAW